MKILLVEDHQDIAGVIFDYFEIKGYTLDYSSNGQHGYELGCANFYDLIILDVMLPRMDGYTVCRKLREHGVETPILMLTARDSREDTLQGFAEGADDYLIKPFDLEILEARINALARRHRGNTTNNLLRFDKLQLNLNDHIVSRDDCCFALNPTLFTIMKLLMLKAPKVVARSEIIAALWGDDEPEGNILRSHIYQLRAQIDKPFKHNYIKTIPKVGYQLIAEVNE